MKQTAVAEDKLDLNKLHRAEYAAQARPALVHTAPAVYLAIRGQGAPGGPEFTEAIGALYGMAFTIKMTRKFAGKQDYAVSKLEARWPQSGAACPGPGQDPSEWIWELLIRTPEFVCETDLKQARQTLEKRAKAAGTERVELLRLDEGQCIQALHTGPYEEEGKTFAAMLEIAASKGYQPAGAHHEIYLSDPRRVEPGKLKTILRVPVRAAE